MATDPDHYRLQRVTDVPHFLRGGFRPFFLGGAVWALVVVALWIAALAGAVTLPTAFDPLAWHRHEMLFGYLGAVIAGFLLTAIPNWTGRLPIAGARLAALAGLWLTARLAVLFSALVGAEVALALDVGFLLVLGTVAAREVAAGAKHHNVPVVVVILLFALASAIDHGEALGLPVSEGLGWRAGFALVLLLVTLIGGRIIPSFTRNWLTKRGIRNGPVQPGGYDWLTIAATAIALACWTVAPDAPATAYGLLAAGALQTLRLGRWSGWRTLSDPLVIILHLSYAWLPLGLVLLGLSMLDPAVPRSAALHALGAGAMASMTLAVMTRATLGHTGRALHADRATVAIYTLVTLGAGARVAAPLLSFDYLHVVELAGLLWGGAFLLFVAAYGPKLLGPRA